MKTPKEQQDLPIDTIRQETTSKLNPSSGTLDYEVGKHTETEEAYLRIVGNNSGGYFSGEWIPISAIQACFGSKHPPDSAFSSRLLRSAFQYGKSANNASFLAAALRNEGLLKPHEKNKFQHYITGEAAAWPDQLLTGKPKRKTAVTDKSK